MSDKCPDCNAEFYEINEVDGEVTDEYCWKCGRWIQFEGYQE